MRCAGLLLWCLLALQAAAVEAQRQFEKQRSLVQAPASAVQRRTASPVDAFGNPVPDSVAIPNIPRAKPPARVTSSAGYLELELVLETVDLLAECEVFRNDADETEPSISCFKGACVTLVKLASLKVDASYTFTTHSVRKVTDGVTGQVFEFHGPRSHPITFVTAGLPDWQLAIPETTSLGSIVMRLSWEEPNTGGSTILGYQVEMETNLLPGWQMIYDGQYDPSVKHLVLQNLSYGTTYFYNVYAINAIGRSKPISTAYTVAVPLEKTYFYPLSTDPSIARDPIPDFIIADVPTDLTIRAKNPVTEWFEVDSTHRNYLAAVHDACELNSERTMCLPVPEQHPDYQAPRAQLLGNVHLEGLNYTGNKTGIYSLMVYAIFSAFGVSIGTTRGSMGCPSFPKLMPTSASSGATTRRLLKLSLGWGWGCWGFWQVTALAGDHITARWVGFLLGPTTDEYTIYVKADDSVRVWFQGDLVIDYWDSSIPCCPELWTRQLIEKDKFYSIKVEWKEMQGNAQLRLMWGITGKRKQIIPGANLWRGAPLESAPFRIVVHPGPPSVQTSGLIEPLERLRTAVSQRLYLQALDTMSNTVNSTDVQFEAYFYPPSYTNATVPLVFRSIPLMLQRQTEHIHDHLHFIDLVLLEPGNYTLELFLKGQGQLVLKFLPSNQLYKSFIVVTLLTGWDAEETNFTLQLRDAFSNPVPHVDGVTVEVDLEFVEEIDANGTMDDRRLRNLTGGHYATATSITKGDFGSYFITYTGLRAGINLLTVKVNGLLIMGQEEQVIYDPPVQGQNRPLTVTGYWNERANGLMTIYAPARIPAECTTGVICAVVFHVRDTYGNRMLGDYHEQMQYRTVDAQCNPLLPEDPWCVPVDEAWLALQSLRADANHRQLCSNLCFISCFDIRAGRTPESLGAYSLEGDSYIRGPTALLVNIGDAQLRRVRRACIEMFDNHMDSPLSYGNVVGTPAPVLVQLKDQYGNDRIVTGSDFLQRRNGISATLGDRELATTVYDNGTIEVTVLIFQAGFHNLRVRIGAGCIQVPVRDPCEDISGSPTTLLWWKEAEVSENGMTCQTPYAMEAGRQYHFTCTGRDVYGNINRDHELVLTSFFNYVVDPEGSEPPDGWFRGNLSANFNHTVAGSYLAADGRYHFDITLYRAGFYELIIEMIKVGSQPAIVLARNVQAEGRPVGEATYVLGFPSLPSFMSSVVGGFVTAAANVANEVTVQTRDRFGNAIEINNGADTVVAQLRGSSPVTLPFLHLIQGRYRGALVPLAAGPTLLEIRVAGEEIVGSPFDFLVTPGPMVTTNSLVEGFPSELTAGVLSCWNITLRDATQNHLLSGQFEADPTQLEPVSCTDVESYCFHTQLNGTFTCCINKTAIDVVPANFLVDTFPFTCQIRGDNIFGPVDMKLWPHPISPYWPDSSLKIGNGMLGPYDYPSYIDDQFGWQDWPTTYVRGVQNIDSGQQQQQLNRLRRWYTDGFYNVFKGDNAAILMCDVKGNHSLGNHTLGRPTRSLYRLPYTLNQELGVFEVELKFERIGYHKVFCSTAVRGGMNVEYRDTDGSILRRVEQGINISAPEQMPMDEEGGAARWDALLYPPRSANYTLILACRGRDAVLIFNNSLRATITTTDDTVDQEQLAVIGPLDLQAQTPYPLQAAWTSNSLSSSVQLRWFSDGGIPEELLPGEHLYNSKTLLSGYPKIIEVSDAAVVRRLQPENANEEEADGQQISAYQLHQFHHDSEDVTEAQAEAEVIPAADTEVEVHVPDSLGIIDPLPDPTKFHRLERRASDDYADEDFEAVGRSMQATTAVTPPDPPETIVLGSDQMTVRIAWIEPSGQNVTGYRVYVDGKLAYDGATDSVTREFTLMNCTRGELRDLAVAAVNAGGETLVPTVITRHCARRPFKPEPPTIVYVDCVKEASPPDRLLIDNHIRIESCQQG
ncbi:rsgI3 [Symbiodinium natans]|uniref:RsgI3 protein n=1 Tax=Symbiodinium natans TaxID=878477 RepID=A0A812V605_9DINO|nr:rsgI3 [Symbiodinium natans]